MLGDTAVMVHPEDERYAHLIGKTVKLPLTDREIPVIADDYVDREFGTGVRQGHAGARFQRLCSGPAPQAAADSHLDAGRQDQRPCARKNTSGLDRFDARKAIVADLEALSLLDKDQASTSCKVPRGDRTGVVIEPMLTDQWFVAMSKPGNNGKSITEQGAGSGRHRRGQVRARKTGSIPTTSG